MRETLREFDNEQDAYDFEKMIVDDLLVENRNCYNLIIGGQGGGCGTNSHNYGKHPSVESKQKMSIWQIGKIVSKETREKISKSNKGRKLSKERIQQMSDIAKGRKHTEESKLKMSILRKNSYILYKE